MASKHKKKKHSLKRTDITHHNDGTHSIRHTHDDGSESGHGAADNADLQAHMASMLGAANPANPATPLDNPAEEAAERA